MLNDISYSRYTQFLLRTLPRWKSRFHRWSDREEAVLQEIVFCVRLATQLYHDVPSMEKYLEEEFGLHVPVIWGALAEPYFENWSKVVKNFNLLCEKED